MKTPDRLIDIIKREFITTSWNDKVLYCEISMLAHLNITPTKVWNESNDTGVYVQGKHRKVLFINPIPEYKENELTHVALSCYDDSLKGWKLHLLNT